METGFRPEKLLYYFSSRFPKMTGASPHHQSLHVFMSILRGFDRALDQQDGFMINVL